MKTKARKGSQVDEWARRLSSSPLLRALQSHQAARVVPLLTGGTAMAIYLLTMAPGVTWEHAGRDGGDFITAVWVFGVPHPTGYPTFSLLARLFTQLPLGSIAWRVNLLSGLAGAATVTMLYLVGRLLASPPAPARGAGVASSQSPGEQAYGPATWGAVVGALLLGFSPLFWGHALIAEVYTLHIFFIALILWLMLRWRDGGGPLWLAALAFGLGMGNHITLTFLGPAIAMLLLQVTRHVEK